MNADIKARWVEALRSGNYKQTIGHLRKSHEDDELRYCCLGVLCDIVKDEMGLTWERHTREHCWWMIDGCDGSLPPKVAILAELDSENPPLGSQSCISANDAGFSFAEIADFIEEYL